LYLRIGLVLGALACLYVTGASWVAGYTPEVAIVRGVIAWGALTLLGYAAELVVVMASPRDVPVPAVHSDAHRRPEGDARQLDEEEPMVS
jgi:hypothetical protein